MAHVPGLPDSLHAFRRSTCTCLFRQPAAAGTSCSAARQQASKGLSLWTTSCARLVVQHGRRSHCAAPASAFASQQAADLQVSLADATTALQQWLQSQKLGGLQVPSDEDAASPDLPVVTTRDISADQVARALRLCQCEAACTQSLSLTESALQLSLSVLMPSQTYCAWLSACYKHRL